MLVKVTSLLLTIACTVIGGMWDLKLWRNHHAGETWLPVGGVLAMGAATMLAPIAWNHYFILLLVPIMFMLDANLRRRSPALIGLVVIVFFLNVYPISSEAVLKHITRFSVVRSQFYAGLLSLLGLGILYMRSRAHRHLATSEAVTADGKLFHKTLPGASLLRSLYRSSCAGRVPVDPVADLPGPAPL